MFEILFHKTMKNLRTFLSKNEVILKLLSDFTTDTCNFTDIWNYYTIQSLFSIDCVIYITICSWKQLDTGESVRNEQIKMDEDEDIKKSSEIQ